MNDVKTMTSVDLAKTHKREWDRFSSCGLTELQEGHARNADACITELDRRDALLARYVAAFGDEKGEPRKVIGDSQCLTIDGCMVIDPMGTVFHLGRDGTIEELDWRHTNPLLRYYSSRAAAESAKGAGQPCGDCGGTGRVGDTGSEHARGCDGNCGDFGCPVPVEIEVECERCKGTGQSAKGAPRG